MQLYSGAYRHGTGVRIIFFPCGAVVVQIAYYYQNLCDCSSKFISVVLMGLGHIVLLNRYATLELVVLRQGYREYHL
ncbi:hypothetical protein VTO42DRAFT_5260 [Malbranchea cinnamomea]